jgi:hypothetical protein
VRQAAAKKLQSLARGRRARKRTAVKRAQRGTSFRAAPAAAATAAASEDEEDEDSDISISSDSLSSDNDNGAGNSDVDDGHLLAEPAATTSAVASGAWM